MTETGPGRAAAGPDADSRQLLEEVTRALDRDGPEQALDALVERLEALRRYQEAFEVLVMKSRLQLGLPLIQVGSATDIPDALVEPHEEAIANACRRVGGRFLADGDLARAWPYLRAIGETREVAAVLESIEPGTRRKDIDTLIEIALHEGVHPSRGLEMVVHQYGLCSSITNFEQFQASLGAHDREACARVLLDSLYADLVDNIRAEIERSEGKAPDETGLGEIIASRPQLFEGGAYYIDSSHLWSVVRFCSFLERVEDLDRALELTDYGSRLSPMFKYESEAPFESYYEDHAVYFRGLRAHRTGDDDDARECGEHFLAKARRAIEERTPGYPARAVLNVLARIGCFQPAIDLALAFDAIEGIGPCFQPSVYELCQLAGDYGRLAAIASDRGDAVPFMAGRIGERSAPAATDSPAT